MITITTITLQVRQSYYLPRAKTNYGKFNIRDLRDLEFGIPSKSSILILFFFQKKLQLGRRNKGMLTIFSAPFLLGFAPCIIRLFSACVLFVSMPPIRQWNAFTI